MFKFLNLFRKKRKNSSIVQRTQYVPMHPQFPTLQPSSEPVPTYTLSMPSAPVPSNDPQIGGMEFSKLCINNYVSPSGSCMNYAIYAVTGRYSALDFFNTIQVEAKTDAEAIERATKYGLKAPYEVKVVPFGFVTENQTINLQRYGVTPPNDLSMLDASAILKRIRYSKDSAPAVPPTDDFARFADDVGVKFSRFVSEETLVHQVVGHLNGADRIAFYAYFLKILHDHDEIGDMRKSSCYDQLKAFAAEMIEDKPFMRSFAERTVADYYRPHKGTTTYKAVAAQFNF